MLHACPAQRPRQPPQRASGSGGLDSGTRRRRGPAPLRCRCQPAAGLPAPAAAWTCHSHWGPAGCAACLPAPRGSHRAAPGQHDCLILLLSVALPLGCGNHAGQHLLVAKGKAEPLDLYGRCGALHRAGRVCSVSMPAACCLAGSMLRAGACYCSRELAQAGSGAGRDYSAMRMTKHALDKSRSRVAACCVELVSAPCSWSSC